MDILIEEANIQTYKFEYEGIDFNVDITDVDTESVGAYELCVPTIFVLMMCNFYDNPNINEIEEELSDNYYKEYYTDNADNIILILNYLILYYDELVALHFNLEVKIKTEHLTWVLHDILHAEYDVSESGIYTSNYGEVDRIVDSWDEYLFILDDYNIPFTKKDLKTFLEVYEAKSFRIKDDVRDNLRSRLYDLISETSVKSEYIDAFIENRYSVEIDTEYSNKVTNLEIYEYDEEI